MLSLFKSPENLPGNQQVPEITGNSRVTALEDRLRYIRQAVIVILSFVLLLSVFYSWGRMSFIIQETSGDDMNFFKIVNFLSDIKKYRVIYYICPVLAFITIAFAWRKQRCDQLGLATGLVYFAACLDIMWATSGLHARIISFDTSTAFGIVFLGSFLLMVFSRAPVVWGLSFLAGIVVSGSLMALLLSFDVFGNVVVFGGIALMFVIAYKLHAIIMKKLSAKYPASADNKPLVPLAAEAIGSSGENVPASDITPLTSIAVYATKFNKQFKQICHELIAGIASKRKPRHFPLKTVGIIAALLLMIGSVSVYFLSYLPNKRDKEAPRYYTFLNSSNILSGAESGSKTLGTLEYGTELLGFGVANGYQQVKNGKTKGYMASDVVLPAKDFFLLNSIFGNDEARKCIEPARCRIALLDYFKKNRLYGQPEGQVSGNYQQYKQGWQVHCRPAGTTPNTVAFSRWTRSNSEYVDFAVIISNKQANESRFLLFAFDDQNGTPLLQYEEKAPATGYIKSVDSYQRNGITFVNVSYTTRIFNPLFSL